MKGIKFLSNPKSYNPDNAFIAHLSGISSVEELFEQLSDKLELPDYFGFNWDALSDSIRDFHWVKQQGIVLVHDDLPNLNKQELKNYLQTLIDAVGDWKNDEDHYLEVAFSDQVKDLIRTIIYE